MADKSGFELILEKIDFRKFADTLSVIIFAYSDDKYIYVNPAFEKALGYRQEEMLHKNFWDVCHPDYRELVRTRGQARLRQEKVPSNYEIRALRKDGSDLWVDVFFSVTQVAGKTISIVGAYDITERKRLQEALALSEAQYRAVVEDQTELILRCRPDGTITFLNNAFCQQFKLVREAMLGTMIESRLFGQQKGILTAVRENLLAGQPFFLLEQEVQKLGSPCWYEWVFRGIADENGEVIEYQAVGRDISERKKAQQILQEARDRLEISVQERTAELSRKNLELTLLNRNLNHAIMNMSDGVITIQKSGEFELLNPALKNSWKEYYQDFEKNFRLWSTDTNNHYMQRLFGSGKAFKNEEIFIPTADVTLRFLASGTPIVSKGGKVASALLIIRPIKEVHHLVNRFSGYTARFHFEDIITCNTHMQEIIDVARMASRNSSSVLIEGESGTGKELFAQAIHNASRRSGSAFVAVNCGAIPRELIASELFGYNEGAFTGAKKGGNPGKFELADGGTLFLDEIGDMPLELQVALLRTIQEKQISRIGGSQMIPIDVRIICATNKNLFEEMQKGNFRRDLFYRLNVIDLHILPLRERTEDITLLFSHFLKQMNPEMNESLEEELQNILVSYAWPGNVRELQNAAERMVNLHQLPDQLLALSQQRAVCPQENPAREGFSIQQAQSRYKNERLEQERISIIHLLNLYNGNVSQVAREMGISRSTLYRKMKNLSFDKL
ncbi:MAG TPA: sigma 54-interacting transcriptional regulator [Syntrophomonas sp.]|nr:sigma 54-interacting transcriptional regulator [Syntrophomonas sp.]